MGKDDRIHQLLEELLSSKRSPDEVCAGDPELLPEVRRQWEQCRRLENDLGILFPSASGSSRSTAAKRQLPFADHPEIDGYRIDSLLGRGGMGVVYKAFHQRLHRAVAIKMLLSGIYASRGEAARFLREARAIAGLRHPHVVQVYDVGECGGQLFYTMEWVEGGSLADRLKGVPQPSKWAAEMMVLLADAVEAAHRAGIIHRDLKPANVLLADDGSPKVSDFGLARKLDGDDMLSGGGRIGTPSYMAPEQVSGNVDAVGPTADVYGLGAILYEMLTGRPPFRGESVAETERQLLATDPASPSRLNARVPRDLDTICLKCLEKDPQRRYPTATELAADLNRFLHNEPIHARPTSWAECSQRWMRRHPGTAASLLTVASLLMLLVIGSLVTTAHFRVLERQQRLLAEEKGKLADEKDAERRKAVDLRLQAETVGAELRRNLYFAQMNLGAQAAMYPGGIGRVGEWLAPWVPNPDDASHNNVDLRNWEWFYLDGLRHRDFATLLGHSGGVRDVAYSPDGKRLASADTDANINIRTLAGDSPVMQMRGDSWELRVVWSPDGHRLASSSYNGQINIWNTGTGECMQTLRCSSGGTFGLAWSPDGAHLASGGHDGAVQIWDLKTGAVQYTLHGNDRAVLDVAWSPDGQRLASASEDSNVRTWDATSGSALLVMHGHVNFVNRVVWSSDSTRLASASNDRSIRIWNASTGDQIRAIDGRSLGINGVVWSPDGTRLVSAGDDQTVRIWSAADGSELFCLRGHNRPVTAVTWSPDGKQIASSSFDKTIKLWKADARAEVPLLSGHTGPISTVAWSPDSKHVASSSMDYTVKVWNVADAKEEVNCIGHTNALRSVAWNPAGTRLASAGCDHTLRIWEAATGKQVYSSHVDADEVWCVAWSPDGTQLISAGTDNVVWIWDATTGKELRCCAGHADRIRSVCWSPDGKRIASGSDDGTCKIWDARTAALLSTIDARSGIVNMVAWCNDGRRLATTHADWTISIWDVATGDAPFGQLLHNLRGHTASVNGLAWSPDGTRLASGSDDHTIKLWDTSSGSEALTLACDENLIKSVSWGPDGMQLASGGDDYVVRIHDATPGYLDARAAVATTQPHLSATTQLQRGNP